MGKNRLKMPGNGDIELDIFCLAPYNDRGEENGGQKVCMA